MISECKTKILHLIDSGGQGGAEQVMISLIESLDNNLYEHHVVLPNKGWLYGRLSKVQDVKIVIYNGRGKFNIKFIAYLLNYLHKNKIQIIHSHLFGTSLYASLTGFVSRVPVICTFHGYIDLRPGDKLQKLKMSLIGLFANRIVAVSDGLNKYLAERLAFGKHKLETIYNGTAIADKCIRSRFDVRSTYGFFEDDIIIGSIGNLKPAKGYDVLLKVAKIVTTKYNNCRFLIVGNTGSDIYEDLLRQREALLLESEVFFLGYLDDTADFLQMLDIFLLTSSSEGFSLATIEAMNAGVPVVATKSGGPQEIITHRITGILANVGDEVDLAQGIIMLIEDTKLRSAIICDAKKKIASKYTVCSMVSKYHNRYIQILECQSDSL